LLIHYRTTVTILVRFNLSSPISIISQITHSLTKHVLYSDTGDELSDSDYDFSDSKQYLSKPQQQQQTLIRPWLIRIIQNSNGKTKDLEF
jgi:hypothetical protein